MELDSGHSPRGERDMSDIEVDEIGCPLRRVVIGQVWCVARASNEVTITLHTNEENCLGNGPL